MNRSRIWATIYGALAGALLALGFFALFGSLSALESVTAILLDPAADRARSTFEVTSGGLYLLCVFLGVVGGLVIGAITYAFGREREPASPKFPLRYLLLVAATISAIMAYAVLRTSIAAAGDITAGTVTISVFRMVMAGGIAGLVAGGLTANAVDALARPAFLGLANEAWPSSPREFAAQTARAIGAPTIAVVTIAALAVSFSQLLLNLEGTAATVAFAGIATLVLGGATLIALRPWDRGSGSGQPQG